MTMTHEFCPYCGQEVFAKSDEQADSVKSRFDIVLWCGECKRDYTVGDTIGMTVTDRGYKYLTGLDNYIK